MSQTPTTEIVRQLYTIAWDQVTDPVDIPLVQQNAREEFDLWHQEELRQAKADGFDEGVRASGLDLDYILQLLDNNPYRKQP